MKTSEGKWLWAITEDITLYTTLHCRKYYTEDISEVMLKNAEIINIEVRELLGNP